MVDPLGPIVDLGPPAIGGLVATVRYGRLPDGREVVIKRAGGKPDVEIELAGEAEVLRVLDGGLRAPRLLDAAPGVLVLERLPGRIDLIDCSARMLEHYAHVLCDIHALDWPGRALDSWSTWAEPEVAPPEWSTDRRLWAEAITISRTPQPASRTVLCHRDFHPGNILLDGSGRTGVIDWGRAMMAPAAVDVSHLANNLAALHGVSVAVDAVAAYRAEAARRGRSVDDLAEPYWWVHEILSWLPDPAHILPPWSAARPDLTEHVVRRRCEDLLRWAVRTPGSAMVTLLE